LHHMRGTCSVIAGSHMKLKCRNSKFIHGQSMVEFAFVVPLFFLLIFGIIDFGRLFFTQMTLQNALRQAGRYAVTGNHITNLGENPGDPPQTLSRVQSIKQIAQKAALGIPISNIQISSQSAADFASGTSNGTVSDSAGGPGSVVTVSLSYDLKFITPIIGQFFKNGTYHFSVSTSFKNEPFSPSAAD